MNRKLSHPGLLSGLQAEMWAAETRGEVDGSTEIRQLDQKRGLPLRLRLGSGRHVLLEVSSISHGLS
jgi:hypothetical protein